MKKGIMTLHILASILVLLTVVTAQTPTLKKAEDRQDDENLVHAIISKKPQPETPDYKGSEINATVVLKAIFRSSGKVTDIKLAKVTPDEISEQLKQNLVKRSIKAAQKIKFIPATKDGHAVSMYMQLEYNFHLY